MRAGLGGTGHHCQQVPQLQVLLQELRQVQTDELRVTRPAQVVWLGLALTVPTWLWPGAWEHVLFRAIPRPAGSGL